MKSRPGPPLLPVARARPSVPLWLVVSPSTAAAAAWCALSAQARPPKKCPPQNRGDRGPGVIDERDSELRVRVHASGGGAELTWALATWPRLQHALAKTKRSDASANIDAPHHTRELARTGFRKCPKQQAKSQSKPSAHDLQSTRASSTLAWISRRSDPGAPGSGWSNAVLGSHRSGSAAAGVPSRQ